MPASRALLCLGGTAVGGFGPMKAAVRLAAAVVHVNEPRSVVRLVRFRLPAWPLILFCYLLLAVAMTWNLWVNPTVRVPTVYSGISGDIFLNDWFMGYAGTAIAHGHLPALVTHSLNAPQGINMMWNTSFLLPGVVLAPVTLLSNPQVSLTLALTLGFFGSATSLFYVLRRWGASSSAAALGGAIFGFSPALRMAGQDHYHLQFAVLLPLIVDAVLLLAVGRGNPLRTGALLGVLVSAQLFIAEEMLVAAAIASVLALATLVLSRPAAVRARLGGTAAGIGVAAAVTLLLSGYALWVQFHGPLTEHGNPWNIQAYTGVLRDFVTAPSNQLLSDGRAFSDLLVATHQRFSEYFAYLGWPLLAVLLPAAVAGWRDLRVRVAAVAFAGLELCSLGGNSILVNGKHLPAQVLPWYWLRGLPILGEALPNRLSILADAAAAAVLLLGLDRLRAALPARMCWRVVAAGALSVLAVLPLIPLFPRPIQATDIMLPPPAWSAVVARLDLPAGARLLVLPANDDQTMAWEANSAKSYSIISGNCIAPGPTGKAAACDVLQSPAERQVLLETSQLQRGVPWARRPDRAVMAAVLRDWNPAAVIADVSANSTLGRYLIGYFGPPGAQATDMLGWRF